MEAGTVGRAPARSTGDGFVTSVRRLSTETKSSFKTSEFWLTLAVIAGILISASQVKGGVDDEFIASQAWLYVAIVTGLYAVGRGLAKSGSREPYTEDTDSDRNGR